MMTRSTSAAVFREMEDNGLLSARRWEAYKILYEHGPLTSNEVFGYAKLHGNVNYRHNTNARMTELRELGVAAEVGVKLCSVTEREVILWDVTDQLPGTLDKSASRPSPEVMRKALKQLRRVYSAWVRSGGEHLPELVAVGKWISIKFGAGCSK